MALTITNVVNGIKTAVAVAGATAIAVETDTLLLTEGLSGDEVCVVYRLGPSGAYAPWMVGGRVMTLDKVTNSLVLKAPSTYKVVKPVTVANTYIGYVVKT
jgi:hypothetical protein